MPVPILGATPPVPTPGAKWVLLQVAPDGRLTYSTNLRHPHGGPATPGEVATAVRAAADAIANDRGGLHL